MTDKQIIVNGVNVSGCNYYADGKCTNSQMIQSNCKNVAVCYYKEYKRKEQILKEIKEILEIHKEQRCITCKYYDNCCNCDDTLLQIIEDKK